MLVSQEYIKPVYMDSLNHISLSLSMLFKLTAVLSGSICSRVMIPRHQSKPLRDYTGNLEQQILLYSRQ